MYRQNRPEAPVFAPDELLYRRYRREHWVGGRFAGPGIQFPKQSVNRGGFSEPEDVLYSDSGEFDGQGVLQCRVCDVPERLELPPAPGAVFFLKHAPVDDNYSHSEIWADKLESTGAYVEPSPSLKKLFRTVLAQRMSIRIEAAI
jgi:hypothetical protein